MKVSSKKSLFYGTLRLFLKSKNVAINYFFECLLSPPTAAFAASHPSMEASAYAEAVLQQPGGFLVKGRAY